MTTEPDKVGNVGAAKSADGERAVLVPVLDLIIQALSFKHMDPSFTRWNRTLDSVHVTDTTLLA